MVRVCKDGKKKYQSIGISIHPSHWDFKKNEPNESCPNRDEIRLLIQQKLYDLQKTILSKRIEGKNILSTWWRSMLYNVLNTMYRLPMSYQLFPGI